MHQAKSNQVLKKDTILKFGKHKGIKASNLQYGYLKWVDTNVPFCSVDVSLLETKRKEEDKRQEEKDNTRWYSHSRAITDKYTTGRRKYNRDIAEIMESGIYMEVPNQF